MEGSSGFRDSYPEYPISAGSEAVTEVDLNKLEEAIAQASAHGLEPSIASISSLLEIPESVVTRMLIERGL